MDEVTVILALIGEIVTMLGIISPILVKLYKLSEGNKCQLRSDMLSTYYHNKDSRKMRQYEYENFVLLYEAYKAQKGNSFIDKIYDEVREWEIIT